MRDNHTCAHHSDFQSRTTNFWFNRTYRSAHLPGCGSNRRRELVYCANSYLDHLDRVRDDPNYAFVLSEVNNIIAIMNFKPERIPELKQRISEKRVELVNGFFLESTVNLSGGE